MRKISIVTGGAKGIGACIAYTLGKKGYSVVIADIDDKAGEYRLKQFRDEGIDSLFVKTDVSSENDVKKLMDQVYKEYGRIDVLINNAGIGFSGRSIEEQTLEEWKKIIDTNLTGTWLCSKYAIKYMKNTGGVIINIASTRAFQSEPNTEPYSASKGGIIALTHSLAVSLSKYSIRVIAISPGWIDTSNWQFPPKESNLSNLDNKQHLTGRVGRPEDIASLVSFLVSDDASWISGVNFTVDGGMTVKMIYLDENIIQDSLSLLFKDEELSILMRKLIERAKQNREEVKNILRAIL
ncbi:SDR family NAD(P)-dependent oxidoreductase [Sulfolobus sp. B1]|uniref:SDR family oxidoreductase n=1 Tax=Sulfolobaceae TaxID=118883 RepID=UPI00084605FF|nr:MULTISPECIES: SDR family oxidoreductase [unclassified Sulfolobus]TRM74026.1 SDR family NAD(P)-dependent oxidoreductase [Sulfolobus sp. E5]TRM77321.1 SDR family NAD(P)-dependent oxidoreductase [Sulfolobus sp. A20-N-F8]TRM79497.1 SDR family NAD(P)-dependent oxidoreductase [Sulfolobus sp. B5]TRM80285.1 SDR family NAD(P)-dependent oxidoreductase [Sulfolobus sp. D5]TRM84508.1 SDR family NAD(P)-dependent oxidoreductase [Sulfolobus sp. F3]TRM86256.1 SDR family NAD(P)-dependent oxidoreductase [Sul